MIRTSHIAHEPKQLIIAVQMQSSAGSSMPSPPSIALPPDVTSEAVIADAKKKAKSPFVALAERFSTRASSPSLQRGSSTDEVPDTPSLKLTQLNKMGTGRMRTADRADKVSQMSRGARRMLEPFARAPRPRHHTVGIMMHGLFLLVQPLLAVLLPASCTGFYASLARAGGESRVRMLLRIAQFDADEDGDISQKELEKFEQVGEHLVELTCQTLQNFSVVGSLLFAATFLAVIGRPVQWAPSAEATDFLGDDGATAVMFVAYVLACGITVATMLSIIYSVGSRYQLTYILASLESKICLLCELNPVGVVSGLFLTVVMLLLVLLALGGMLAVGRGWGFVAPAVFPLALYCTKPLFRQFLNGACQLHLERRGRRNFGQHADAYQSSSAAPAAAAEVVVDVEAGVEDSRLRKSKKELSCAWDSL